MNVFNLAVQAEEQTPTDPVKYAELKVANFIEAYPLNLVFVRREKARLPYSVFKPVNEVAWFLRSVYSNRPPTAFFPYPSYVGLERGSVRLRKYAREEVEGLFMAFRVADTTHVYNAVVNTCKHAGLNMVEGRNSFFNVQWTGYITAREL